MTLEAALKQYIEDQSLYGGSVSFVGFTGNDEGLLVRTSGSWRKQPETLSYYPRVNLYLRSKDRATGAETMRGLHSAFDLRLPLALTETFLLTRSETDGLPLSLGQIQPKLFAWTLDLLLVTTQNAQI